jgi:bifunctional NMN adenylyltransferase/nudix hydrolase
MNYDTLVLIGRFQPVHSAHAEIIRRAMEQAKQLIIIVGSAKQPRTYKNPWTSAERRMMLQNVCDTLPQTNCAIRIEENIDTIYNDQAWAARVQTIVRKHTQLGDKVGIIGHKKDDATSSYLDMFPQWGFQQVELIQPLHATNIRDLYFKKNANLNFLRGVVPQPVMRLLEGWVNTPDYMQVIAEREFVEKYKQQYASLPYPPIFSTADAAVIQSGHVLMIKRRAEPGRGLWALPGGYVNALTDKSVKAAALRELREETGLKVPLPVLDGSIKGEEVFDAIDRSPRGRIITHCFKIVLPDGALPKVKGDDDAEKAKWVPIGEVDSSKCFEDHYEMIQWAVGA